MRVTELAISDVFLVEPEVFPDDRGLFLEVFSRPAVESAVGRRFTVAQVNGSVSRRGTIRGLHGTALPGQARFMHCAAGSFTDIVVDVRVGSPTYGEHVAVELSAENRHGLFLAEGLVHGFAPLGDEATMIYLCTSTYAPGSVVLIDPLDPALGLPWPGDVEPVLSASVRAAPTLREARRLGMLPTYADCRRQYSRAGAGSVAVGRA